ncbi:MAG TPA: DUF1840 domain-containing protein [Leucothrix mucor]|nr:DUF1840 domain-containing protein [Leucothrix mucor]
MLIQFSCKTSPNVSMFESYAKHMLKLMNQSGKVPGALRPEDIAVALKSLQQGLSAEKNQDDEDEVSMSTRAYPLTQLLKHAITEKEHIMWDYDTGLI